ncbi:MAG: cysteine hydrolase [Clostridia bacterium]|jgi:nicotinamidase-related amidase|nr:cysteine hydrolase [Clostridia bacterium]MCI1999830.1 cysteine hydrolase [Clostridia bacterium]MCI2014254.1 cysteine hydrolase [Clostridia bacterium]
MKELLAVIDMQNDFINGALGTPQAENIVNDVCEKIRDFKGDIVCTRDTHGRNYLNTLEGKKLPVVHCIKDTDGWQLNSDVYKAAVEKKASIIDKPSFGSIELAEFAKNGGYDKVILIGLCTDICVISNALIIKAYLPEVPVAVIKNLCAGVSEQSHENAVSAMEMCQIEIL